MEKAEKSKSVTFPPESVAVPAAGSPKSLVNEVRVSAQGKRYGEAVKRLVVEQIETGKLTVAQAQRQHAIAGAQTIRGWQAKYGKAGGGVRRASALAAAQEEIVKLRREKAELEHALARSTVKAIVLESALEEAEAQYGEDFKKSSDRGCPACAPAARQGKGEVLHERCLPRAGDHTPGPPQGAGGRAAQGA
jgi:transposase